jgi:hypothetical protein
MDYHCYISEKGVDNVLNFKYKGGNDSIFYSYIWSPLA